MADRDRPMTRSAPPPGPEQHLARLAPHWSFADRRMLDVGCGDGSFVRALLDHGADAVGLEVEPETLARARASGLEEARLVLGDGSSLPFADQSFDAVCCVFSFHHIPAEAQPAMIDEIARVLRPGAGSSCSSRNRRATCPASCGGSRTKRRCAPTARPSSPRHPVGSICWRRWNTSWCVPMPMPRLSSGAPSPSIPSGRKRRAIRRWWPTWRPSSSGLPNRWTMAALS
ncbi:methyltransferase domain-containing protein [Aquicoccus sp. SCR17]|nr:methyltransferase domain-containing protein [Carideicomes alvinocaridis]